MCIRDSNKKVIEEGVSSGRTLHYATARMKNIEPNRSTGGERPMKSSKN